MDLPKNIRIIPYYRLVIPPFLSEIPFSTVKSPSHNFPCIHHVFSTPSVRVRELGLGRFIPKTVVLILLLFHLLISWWFQVIFSASKKVDLKKW